MVFCFGLLWFGVEEPGMTDISLGSVQIVYGIAAVIILGRKGVRQPDTV
jgi:hypothetical protein